MHNWQQKSLGDFIELKRGYDLPSRDRLPGEFPLVTSSGATEFISQSKVKGPGVITGRYGTVGQVFYVQKDFWPLNTALYVRDFRGNDPRFVYYFLQGIDWEKFNDKSGVPGINRNDVHREVVFVPPLDQQKQISSVLGALDNKIELNRQTNETLEALAQAIFRDWFVDFGPVRRKMAGATDPVAIMGRLMPDPARAAELAVMFPDTLGEDEMPVGWHLRRIEEFIELAYGKSMPKTARRSGNVPVYGSGGIGGYHDESIHLGPGIIVGRKGTVGSLFWEPDPFFAIDTVFYVVTKKGVSLQFAWQMLQTLGLADMNTDAAVPGLNRSNVYRLEFPGAPADVLLAFEEVAGPLRAMLDAKSFENRTLAETRDYLLPRLMSGEVRVVDAERMAG